MVYINTFNAVFFLLMDIIIAGFVLLVAYLWIQNLEAKGTAQIYEQLNTHPCNCLTILSDNGAQLFVMNTNCGYVVNLTINGAVYNKSLYNGDFVIYNYNNRSIFTFNYNTCVEYYRK